MTPAVTRSQCRICGSTKLRVGLDLGELPLANSFLSPTQARSPDPDPKYALRVSRCDDCGLIQLLDIVEKEEMFDEYSFLTATSNTSLIHFDEFAETLTKRLSPTSSDLVIDIGSNDGTLLKAFKRHGVQILGIEPAHNVARRAIADGVPTLNEYLTLETVERVGRNKARIISANNIISHVNDLSGFLEVVSQLLDPHGVFAFEVPWVVDVLHNYNFDIVYHEHLSYFGFKPLSQALESHGLELIDIQHFPAIHGGTLRGFAAHSDRFDIETNEVHRIFTNEEEDAGFEALARFAKRASEIRSELKEMLRTLKRAGKRIVGYGAPAKASILLNYCEIDRSILDFIIDTTPLKQGKYVPGVRIPIVSPEEFRQKRPDYALLLAWNYKDEILQKEMNYRKAGGKFIIPFPRPKILD